MYNIQTLKPLFLFAYIDSYPQSPLQEAALGVFNKAALSCGDLCCGVLALIF